MSGLMDADVHGFALVLQEAIEIGRQGTDCDVTALGLAALKFAPTVEAIAQRLVNEALTEAADAVFEYACGWSREPLARTAAKGAAAIVRSRTT